MWAKRGSFSANKGKPKTEAVRFLKDMPTE